MLQFKFLLLLLLLLRRVAKENGMLGAVARRELNAGLRSPQGPRGDSTRDPEPTPLVQTKAPLVVFCWCTSIPRFLVVGHGIRQGGHTSNRSSVLAAMQGKGSDYSLFLCTFALRSLPRLAADLLAACTCRRGQSRRGKDSERHKHKKKKRKSLKNWLDHATGLVLADAPTASLTR